LLIVLVIVGAIFIIGLAAITSATRTTQLGGNFAAATMAMQAAQSGLVVADRRLVHPWYVNYTIDEPWPGNGGFDLVPAAGDGLGRKYNPYYCIQVTTNGRIYTVRSTGRAVRTGGSVGNPSDVAAERTVTAVFERPKIEVPYAILGRGDVDLRSTMTVVGDVFANDDVTVNLGARLRGKAYAADRVYNYGTIDGGSAQYQDAASLPPIVYYGYRPSYDYGGMDCTAVQLSGTSLSGSPALGVPGNPNNVFFTNQTTFVVMGGTAVNDATLVSMNDVVIQGHVTIKASAGFPALIIRRDLILTDGCLLETEGLVQIGGKVRGVAETLPAAAARWVHKGPVIFAGSNSFAPALASQISIETRTDRVEIQPVGHMVLPLIKRSYSEMP